MKQLTRYVLILGLGLLGILVQGTILSALFGNFVVPNFLIILVVYLAFRETSALGAILVFLIGLELDIYSGKMLGPWAGAFTIVFAILALLSQRVFIESAFAAFCAVFVSSLVSTLVYISFVFNFYASGIQAISTALLEAFLSGLVAPFVFMFLDYVLKRREKTKVY